MVGRTRSGRVFAAVDLGASGGRVMAGIVHDGRVRLDEVHRFPNGIVQSGGHLRWDVTRLFDEVLIGLQRLAARHPQVESIGIDTWGVDYGLLDGSGRLMADPIAYRDPRTSESVPRVHAVVPPRELYEITGVQHLPFNTLYQLACDARQPWWNDVAHVLLIPDLLTYWLTGTLGTEETNASTTASLDVRTREWSARLLDAVGVDAVVFAPFVAPGAERGRLRPEVRERTGLGESVSVTTVGSHDTASAVAAIPMSRRTAAYVSCGTWSLVGVELDAPVVEDRAFEANFTNELGVDGRTRFLRNVSGLWLLQESLRAWADSGRPQDLVALLAEAAELPDDGPRFDVERDDLVAPDDMPARIHAAVGHVLDPVATVPAIIDSLADAFAATIAKAALLGQVPLEVVHVVGGGSRNDLLCQRVATMTGRPVLAGPADCTALGNVLVQARTAGAIGGTLDDVRANIAEYESLQRYEPEDGE